MKKLFIIFCTYCLPYITSQAQTTQVQYLSGTDKDHTIDWEFYCSTGRKSGYWTTIAVPSCWEQQGFGTYNYGRDYRTYGRNFRFADEKGQYRYDFNVPASWKQRKVYIVFEGSMTDTEVKINGKPAGPVHRGAFYRFKYDISDKLNIGGSNRLEVTVSKMSADESVNNAERLADYWIFGGIFRPVYLEAYPEAHISQTAIKAEAGGDFTMNVFLDGPQLSKKAMQVSASIQDMTGHTIASFNKSVSGNDSMVQLHYQVGDIHNWTAETPRLYYVTASLMDGKRILHTVKERFGFRTIEIRKGDGIYLNGTKIKMKGINRHVFWPETGRTVSAGIDLDDVLLIKEMNMNAVRCSHYPPDKTFLEYCDSLGLYVLDELAGWQQYYSTAAGAPLVKEMVSRDVNHPSVIFWSNGNEGGHNKELDDDYGMYDLSNRPVIHCHHRPGNAFNGIDCNHYENYYSTQDILKDSNIYMPTEFLHSQDDGGGGAALYDFWELHWNASKGAGGFLWALLDEGLVRTDQNGLIDVNGVNAPDGVLGPHREKEGSFYAIREIYSPVRIDLQKLPAGFNGSIPVENRYHFTNLKQCNFEWQLVNFMKPFSGQKGMTILKKGNTAGPDIAPVGKGHLQLSLPADWKNYDALVLKAFDPFGKELYAWTWRIRTNEAILDGLVKKTTDKVTVTENDSTVQLASAGIAIVIDRKTGLLIHNANGRNMPLSLSNGPLPVNGTLTVQSIKVENSDSKAVVDIRYTGELHDVKWTMLPGGWVQLDYTYQPDGVYPFAGISFSYPENFILGATWLGKGPYRVWKNRLQGATDNVWSNMNNATHTGSFPWNYPEFKGYFADMAWLEMNTVEGKFLVAVKEPGLYVRLFDFYGLSGKEPSPALPKGDISFLDAIPPIGTKLALNIDRQTARLGPSSELTRLHAPIKHTLYFYFGLPPVEDQKENFTMPSVNDLF